MNYTLMEQQSKEIRRNIISISDYCAGKVHWGSALSCVEIINAIYHILYNTNDKKLSVGNQFINCKGHAALAQYTVMYEHGLIGDFRPNYQKDGTIYSEEIAYRETMGFPCSTGSLGLGFPYATGMAIRLKKENSTKKVYVLCGDGECDEGSVWESVLFSAHNKLDNIVLVVDCNGIQADGKTKDILDWGDMSKKFAAFGWAVDTIDGHSYCELVECLNKNTFEKPHVIIAKTVKGRGISFMENDFRWHDRVLSGELKSLAKKEVE